MTYILDLELFKNAFSDNHNRIKKFANLTEQNNYYAALSDKKSIQGNFNKIGDNITIVGTYTDFSNYNYGRFKYQNVWFYFSVVDYLVVNESKLNIMYSLDYYETSRFQYDMFLGKGTIQNITTEYEAGKINKIPYSGNGLGHKKETVVNSWDIAGVLLYIYDSTHNRGNVYIYLDSYYNFFMAILQGTLLNFLTTSGVCSSLDDIRGCWLLPAPFAYLVSSYGSNWREVGAESFLYEWNPQVGDVVRTFTTQFITHIKRTDTEYTVFKDSKGTVIWEIPTGEYVDKDVKVKCIINVGPTNANIRMYIGKDTSDNIKADSSDYFAVLPLETVTIFNEAYTEYSARQRNGDIELRHLANEQQLWNGMLNVGTSATNGAISGAMATGNPVGAVAGAVASAVGSTVGSVGGYFLNEYYGNRQQDVIDEQYKKAFDTILLHGDGVVNTYTNYTYWGVYNIKYDGNLGSDRIEKILDTYGWNINLHYPDIQSYINYIQTVNGESYIMGNFEVNGHIPDNWKRQIKERFNGGVTFG